MAFCLGCLLGSWQTSAQSTNSTYSRFGIGSVLSPGNIKSMGMGGLQSSLLDPNTINIYNPASYSILEMTTFQVSGRGTFLNSETSTANSKYRGGSVAELSIAFKKPGSKWGFAAGIRPYSISGYALTQSAVINDSLSAEYRYEGSGGLNEAVLGAGHFRIIKNKRVVENPSKGTSDTLAFNHVLAIGLNLNYLFGNITQTNRVEFSNITYDNTRVTENLFAQGFAFQGGLQYQIPLKLQYESDRKILKESTYFQIGATYSYTVKDQLRTSTSSLIESYSFGVTGAESVVDTAYQNTGLKGHLQFPNRYTVGISIRKSKAQKGTVVFGLEYTAQNWSAARLISRDGSESLNYLNQSYSLGAGFEYKPSDGQNTNLWHAMHYRFGVRFEDSYLSLNNVSLQNQTVSAGISIPLMKTSNRLHISAEHGRFGTTDNNLILEKQTTLWVGFTFTPREPWFFQRKYD